MPLLLSFPVLALLAWSCLAQGALYDATLRMSALTRSMLRINLGHARFLAE